MEGRGSGVARSNFGHAEFGMLVDNGVRLSSRQLYTELRSGLEIENSHQHEAVPEATGADEMTG